MSWNPIETAPRDGEAILATARGHTPIVVYWCDWLEAHWQPLGQVWREVAPTHWMPLPQPPAPSLGG